MELTGGKPIVSVSMTDGEGHPLTPADLDSASFTIAQIVVDEETGLSKYQSLLVRTVSGQPFVVEGEAIEPALAEATQPFSDGGGQWSEVAAGSYTYAFTNTLTTEVDPGLTTSVGVYASKDARTWIANDVYTFVPAGGEPTALREIVTTEACNGCHNPLALHGGVRREVGLCVTCHTDQNVDPETGNVLEFKVMIHRIHSGAQLPSVEAGTPYQIVGFRQSVHDYTQVVWPQDTRNCTTCHAGGGQSDFYMTKPNIAACTACHDTTNPITGENHAGGRRDDSQCSTCHAPEKDEFDASVAGAHLLPANSSQVKGVNLEIVNLAGVVPGGSPVVTFRVTDNAGEVIAPDTMARLAATLAGPTSDYQFRWTEVMTATSVAVGDGSYVYTFTASLPDDATGTFAVGLEGGVNEVIEGENVRITGFNPVTYAAVGDGQPSARRQVVEVEKCNACHNSLALHGSYRRNTEYCVMCHNPLATDEARRPAEAMPPTTINFRVLIHRIHSGAAAAQIYGFDGTLNDFSHVVFPGNLAACETCHVPNSYGLPLARGIQSTIITQEDEVVETILPTRSICTACHESAAVGGHSELQTTSSGIETCEVCHGAGSEFDVYAVHP